MAKIKVGYLISYDYDLVFTSLKQVYELSDKIFLAVDKNRKTWSGNDFHIPQSFFEELRVFDRNNKITVYEDNFSIPELTPMQNETRERNMLLEKMGKGWLIQLDADEYIYDFQQTVNYLKRFNHLMIWPKMTPVIFKGKLVTLFRKLENGFLYIENNEKFPFITNQHRFTTARYNPTVHSEFTNINVIHQSWARNDEEILQKIKNWGHRDDFDTMKYFDFWRTLNSENYMLHRNVHPLRASVWNELKFMECSDVDEFIRKYSELNPQKLKTLTLRTRLKLIIQFFLKKPS